MVRVGRPSPSVPRGMVAIWSQFRTAVARPDVWQRPGQRPMDRLRRPWSTRFGSGALPHSFGCNNVGVRAGLAASSRQRGHCNASRRPWPACATSPSASCTHAATAASLPRCAAPSATPPGSCHCWASPAREPDILAPCRGPGRSPRWALLVTLAGAAPASPCRGTLPRTPAGPRRRGSPAWCSCRW
jgi:hypothetical protein